MALKIACIHVYIGCTDIVGTEASTTVPTHVPLGRLVHATGTFCGGLQWVPMTTHGKAREFSFASRAALTEPLPAIFCEHIQPHNPLRAAAESAAPALTNPFIVYPQPELFSMSLAPNSPRLPSPPPAAEIQIGSPSMANTAATRQAQAMEQTILDANAKRRVRPGTRAADMAAGPPIVPLDKVSRTSPGGSPAQFPHADRGVPLCPARLGFPAPRASGCSSLLP